MQYAAVIVAAGAGRRAGGDTPKQWRPLSGRPVTLWSVEAFEGAGAAQVIVVVSREDAVMARQLFAGRPTVTLVEGGAERIDSVRAGLSALSEGIEAVMIHDAARPLLTRTHIEALLTALEAADGALPALAVSDTLKRTGADGVVARHRRSHGAMARPRRLRPFAGLSWKPLTPRGRPARRPPTTPRWWSAAGVASC